MKPDITIAREANMMPISVIADELDVAFDYVIPYGRYKAKLDMTLFKDVQDRPNGKLILVTAMSPTPAGEGKSTITVGLAQALHRIGHKAIAAIREPSLGPNFGLKGGATGGGYAQVLPMDEINLHFTGDFHAVTTAHNLLAAVIDNHLHFGNLLRIDPDSITWKRVVDLNDRALRDVVIGLGGKGNGVTRETGFDITVASEIMAVLCLVESMEELKEALARILVGYTYDRNPVFVHDLGAEGAMAALLKEALHPNLVQTIENTPALVHGGPFGNIAHGCNSLNATKLGLKLGDYVVTEAGFGADLGAEKFFDIKCRKGELQPAAVVLVATVRALKFHGGVRKAHLDQENIEAVTRGFANLLHHARIIRQYNVPFVVAINQFTADTEAELLHVESLCKENGFAAYRSQVWEKGGAGGEALAKAVVQKAEQVNEFSPLYSLDKTIEEKIGEICHRIYGAQHVKYTAQAKQQLTDYERLGWDKLPICMAKTPYSFSDDATQIGDVADFTITVKEIRASLGAGFLVCLTGDIMTMPGLPRHPNAERVTVDEHGDIQGLF